jgi:hypothetical protein
MTPELLSSYDPLYHIAHARALASGEVMNLPQLSTLTGMQMGPWIAYQLLLAPFTTIFSGSVGTLVGAQIGHGMLVGALAAILFLIIRQTVTVLTSVSAHQAMWIATAAVAIMPLISFGFLIRMLMLRPQVIAVAVTMTAIYFMIRRHWWLLFGTALLYPLLYSAVFLLLIPALVHSVVGMLWDRANGGIRARALTAPGVVLAGLSAGTALRPETSDFLFNAIFVHLASIANRFVFFAGGSSPQELVSAGAGSIILWLLLMLILVALVPLTAYARRRTVRDHINCELMFLLGLTGAYVLLLLFFSRATEYLVPVWGLTLAVLIASAVPLRDSFVRLRDACASRYPGVARDARAFSRGFVQRRHFRRATYAGVAVIGVLYLATQVSGIFQYASHGISTYQKQQAAQFLREQAAGERIFHMQWSDYPHLVYFNPDSTYFMGMDSMFTYFSDREQYWLWYHIASDEPLVTCNERSCGSDKEIDSYEALRDTFGASYLYVSSPHGSLSDVPEQMWAFEDDERFTRVYSYRDARNIPRIRIYRLERQTGPSTPGGR